MDVESEIHTVRSRIAAYDGILIKNSGMVQVAVTGKRNEARDLMRNRLFDLEVTQKDMESKFKPDHPRLVSIRNQIKDAKDIVSNQDVSHQEVTEAVSPAYQQLNENKLVDQAALAGLITKEQMLTQSQDRVHQEIASLNSTERKIKTIENDVAVLENRYSDAAIKLEQARMDDVLAKERITSVNLVQPATYELRPISPNKPLCLVAGLFSAFALAISLPVWLDVRNGRGPQWGPKNSSLDDWGFEQREENEVIGTAERDAADRETVHGGRQTSPALPQDSP